MEAEGAVCKDGVEVNIEQRGVLLISEACRESTHVVGGKVECLDMVLMYNSCRFCS